MLLNGTDRDRDRGSIEFRWSLARCCFGRLREYGMTCGVWVVWVTWAVWAERDAQVVVEEVEDQNECDGA